MKSSQGFKAFLSDGKCLLGKSLYALLALFHAPLLVGGLHAQHDGVLLPLNHRSGFHELTEANQSLSRDNPGEDLASSVRRHLFGSVLPNGATEALHNPFQQAALSIGHRNDRLMDGTFAPSFAVGPGLATRNVDAPLSIHNAGHVAQIVVGESGPEEISHARSALFGSNVTPQRNVAQLFKAENLAICWNPLKLRLPKCENALDVPMGNQQGRLTRRTLRDCTPDSQEKIQSDLPRNRKRQAEMTCPCLVLNRVTTSQSQDPVLNEMAKLLGISLRETEDVLTRDLLASTASQINCTGGTNGDNPTEMTRDDIDLVVATLVDNNAYTIASVIEGEDRFGTAPVRDAFFAMASSQLIGDFEQVNGFIAKAQYPSQMSVLREEWGSISNLRFLVSSIGSVSPTSSALGADVYNIFCVGMEAYQFIEQDGYSAQFIYRPPYFSDALAQNATVAWKAAMVPLISNDLWVINLRTTKAS